MSTYESKQDHIKELKTPPIEVFKNIYPDQNYRIDMEIPEFTAVCPKTGLPDFGTLYLSYRPNEFCLELKSLKEYVLFYRDVGIFHENVVNRVLDDIVLACKPRWARLNGDYNIRGGIKTRVSRTYSK
ncbi:MAG: NADPH-dependent 7-cyano-7-deazaguanine reductase QueF [Leptospirales bacterium]|nr:NADPH-dependent 7-cyano-7-deazaguanine reductase QueF [Leptospirales bacterium]